MRKVDSINLVDSITTLHHIARVDTLAFVKRSVDSIIYLPAGGYGDSIRVVQKAELDSGISSVQTGSLGSLGATVTLFPQGKPYVSFAVDSSLSLHGVVVVEIETNAADTNWDSRYFWNGDACTAQDSLPNANSINKREYTVPVQETAVGVRLRVSAYTSGHANGIIRAGYLSAQGGLPIQCAYGIDSTLAPGGGYSGEKESAVSISIGGRDETGGVTWGVNRHRTVTVTNGPPSTVDFAMVVRALNQSRSTGTTTLGAANALVQVNYEGYHSVGFTVGASTLLGTLVCETTAGEVAADTVAMPWLNDTCISGATYYTSGIVNPAANGNYQFLTPASSRQARVRISAYTSGNVVTNLIASHELAFASINPCLSVPVSGSLPIFGCTVSGVDTAGKAQFFHFHTSSSTPLTSEPQLVVATAPNSGMGVVKQLDSLNLIDSISTIHNVTLVRQVDSLNLVDSITAISHVTTVTTVGTVNVSTPRVADTTYCQAGAKSAADSVVLPSYGGSTHQYITWLYASETDTLALSGTTYDSLTTTNFTIPLIRFPNVLAANSFGTWLNVNYTAPMPSVSAATATKFRLSAPGTGGYWNLCVGYYHQ